MNKKTIFFIFSLVLISFVYLIFNFEFRTPILSGFILAALTFPLYKKMVFFLNKLKLTKFSETLSSIFIVIIGGCLLYFISSFVILQIISEIRANTPGIVDWFQEQVKLGRLDFATNWVGLKSNESINLNSDLVDKLGTYLNSLVSVDNATKVYNFGAQIFNNLFAFALYVIIFVIAWFNGLIFGPSWIKHIINLMPIESNQKIQIKHEIKLGIRNVIYANLLSGLLNAIFVLIIMTVFNLPGAFIIALFTFIVGFLPLTPSELGYVPVILLLALSNPFLALIVAIFAELFILYLNYGLLPKVVLTGTEGNPLFIITSVLAGISFFGIMGFIIGPTIMIFINTFSNITYRNILDNQAEHS